MSVGQWPADKIERRAVKDLIPYARNARTHSDAQVAQIAASIKEWGWTNPILIDETDGIIAGHGRILAAHKLNIADVPTVVARGWTDAQKKAYVLADNQLALNAGWDASMLRIELTELKALDFDLPLIGFGADELQDLLGLPADVLAAGGGAGSLADKFGVVPFSVLNAREGWWQDRKRAWLAIGIASELGRGENAGARFTMSETIQGLKPGADPAAKGLTYGAKVAGPQYYCKLEAGKAARNGATPGGGGQNGCLPERPRL